MARQNDELRYGAAVWPLPAGTNARARGLSFAPRKEPAHLCPRAALSTADRLRCSGAEIGCGTGRHGAEIQPFGTPGDTARIRAGVRGRADHADFGGAGRRTQNVEEFGELRWDHGSAGRNVREADVDFR